MTKILITIDLASKKCGWSEKQKGLLNSLELKKDQVLEKLKNLPEKIPIFIIIEKNKHSYKPNEKTIWRKGVDGQTMFFNQQNDIIREIYRILKGKWYYALEIQASEWKKYVKETINEWYLELEDDNLTDSLAMMLNFKKIWMEKFEKFLTKRFPETDHTQKVQTTINLLNN